MTTLSVPAQACKPAVASPARPKPRPNPRRRKSDCEEQQSCIDRELRLETLILSPLNKKARKILMVAECLIDLIDDLHETDAEDVTLAMLKEIGLSRHSYSASGMHPLMDLKDIDDTVKGARWVIQAFVDSLANGVYPWDDYAEYLADNPKARTGKRVPR